MLSAGSEAVTRPRSCVLGRLLPAGSPPTRGHALWGNCHLASDLGSAALGRRGRMRSATWVWLV